MPEPFDLAATGLEVHPEIGELVAKHPDVQALAYRDGEFLVRELEESKDIFILLDGGLVVERESPLPGVSPVVLACVVPDEGPAIVGEMAYLGALRRTASVRSSGLSRVLRLEPAHVDRIIEGFPMLTRVICRQFSRRLQETSEALSKFQARFALNPARRMAQDGEVLFVPGEPARELHQLLAGTIRLVRAGQVEILTPESLPQGFLDLDTYLRGRVRTAEATVEGMAFLAVMADGDRETLVRCFPDLALKVIAGA